MRWRARLASATVSGPTWVSCRHTISRPAAAHSLPATVAHSSHGCLPSPSSSLGAIFVGPWGRRTQLCKERQPAPVRSLLGPSWQCFNIAGGRGQPGAAGPAMGRRLAPRRSWAAAAHPAVFQHNSWSHCGPWRCSRAAVFDRAILRRSAPAAASEWPHSVVRGSPSPGGPAAASAAAGSAEPALHVGGDWRRAQVRP